MPSRIKIKRLEWYHSTCYLRGAPAKIEPWLPLPVRWWLTCGRARARKRIGLRRNASGLRGFPQGLPRGRVRSAAAQGRSAAGFTRGCRFGPHYRVDFSLGSRHREPAWEGPFPLCIDTEKALLQLESSGVVVRGKFSDPALGQTE